MSTYKPQISEELREELDRSGVPWRVERGKKHDKLFVGNRMVQALTRGYGEYARSNRNATAVVRRAVR